MKLEITKEKVLKAAEDCSQAKQTLKTLFPEAFTNEDCIVPDEGDVSCENDRIKRSSLSPLIRQGAIEIRTSGIYQNKGFFLNKTHNWVIKRDDQGSLCLIPTKL